MSGKRPALEALSAAEKAAVLDELLAARPDLREPAEAYAVQVMTDADRVAVADDVESALQGRDIEELNTRAGHQPGRGYVHPAEAADEILDEALQPFLDDLHRRAGLGIDLVDDYATIAPVLESPFSRERLLRSDGSVSPAN